MYFVLVNLWLVFTFLSGRVESLPLLGSQPPSFDLTKMETLFSFGDSYTTEYLDLRTMKYPSSDDVSSTNGANWVHYFTETSKLKDWNLASNSAPIQNDLVNQTSSVVDIDQQITKLFVKYFVKNETQSHSPEKTLYDIWVGINDLGQLFANKTTTPLDTLVKRYKELIYSLNGNGAKYIAVINVPPIDRSPKWAAEDTVSKMKSMVESFNQKVYDMTKELAEDKSLRVFYVDAWTIFNEMLDNPTNYGFKNVTGYCPNWRKPEENDCLPIDNYFWLNNLHPTTKVHAQFAKEMKTYLK
ncbi:unnamed protein product [Absidia cylindrospora]